MSRHQNLWGFQPSKVEFTHVSWRLHNKCLVNEIESTIMQQEWGIEPKKMHSSNKQGFAQHADLSKHLETQILPANPPHPQSKIIEYTILIDNQQISTLPKFLFLRNQINLRL